MEELKETIYPRIILGLDISTSCIGVCVVEDDGVNKPKILHLSHKTPKINRKIKGIEALCLRKQIFEEEFIAHIATAFTITDVIIEEPLLSSNNVNTVATLLRFNGMISEAIYRIIGVVPNFISSYDARMYSFPELVSVRKYNKKGEEYSIKHIDKALKDNSIVLFGSYPFDIDKKSVMMNMVNELYNNNEIEWLLNKKGELAKENYDACDALICTLAYININHYGLDKPLISEFNKKELNDKIEYHYKTKIWDKEFDKLLTIHK
jgi:hypothetical protein